jgi:galactokinase
MTLLSSSATPQLPRIADQAFNAFLNRFGHPPLWLSVAPGRVNLIGEHIDYNDGYVLPVAIDRYTAIAAAPSPDDSTHIVSHGMTDTIRTHDFQCIGQPHWAAYVLGPLLLCREQGLHPGPFTALVVSDVPRGAGLSSSAALEVASATLAEVICDRSLGSIEKARLCQRAEHDYAHVPCGIMDQATSVAARANAALLLDCQAETWKTIPFGQSDVCLLIANTNVRHSLADGQYAKRRQQCDQALRAIGASSYRDIDLDALESATLDDIPYKRARHVLGEIARTREAAGALERADWVGLGQLMNESHHSLRDDYQVSCAELDKMASIAWNLGPTRGVFGSRMTGGGFGGCTVSLILSRESAAITQHLQNSYREETGIEAEIFVVEPSDGAQGIRCEPPQKS